MTVICNYTSEKKKKDKEQKNKGHGEKWRMWSLKSIWPPIP